MKPSAIASVFHRGSLTSGEAINLFIRCAEAYDISEIAAAIPESLEPELRSFVLRCPNEDIDVIGMDVPSLKKEWIQGFKAYYRHLAN